MNVIDVVCYGVFGIAIISGLIWFLSRHGNNIADNHRHDWKQTGFELRDLDGSEYKFRNNDPGQMAAYITHYECAECGEKHDDKEVGFV